MFKIIMVGKIRAISTSKIKKIIAIKKNRKEKGNRAELIGSNPHSNGDDFSRSIVAFFDKIEASPITTTLMIKITKPIIKVKKITYTKNFRPHNWKSCILFILYKLIIYLISKLKCTGIVTQHLQNASIMQLLQIQNGDY